jgi:hypothetical protein
LIRSRLLQKGSSTSSASSRNGEGGEIQNDLRCVLIFFGLSLFHARNGRQCNQGRHRTLANANSDSARNCFLSFFTQTICRHCLRYFQAYWPWNRELTASSLRRTRSLRREMLSLTRPRRLELSPAPIAVMCVVVLGSLQVGVCVPISTTMLLRFV